MIVCRGSSGGFDGAVKVGVEVHPKDARVAEHEGEGDGEEANHHDHHPGEGRPSDKHDKPHWHRDDESEDVTGVHSAGEIAWLPFKAPVTYRAVFAHGNQATIHATLVTPGAALKQNGRDTAPKIVATGDGSTLLISSLTSQEYVGGLDILPGLDQGSSDATEAAISSDGTPRPSTQTRRRSQR